MTQLLVSVSSGLNSVAVALRREICSLNASPIVPQLIDQIGGDRYFILPVGRAGAQFGRA